MYAHLVIGGTFDHLHSGHKKLLTQACSLSDQLTIGLTTDILHVHKQYRSSIQSYEDRENVLLKFLRRYKDVRVTIIPIHDMYGTTLTDQTLDAILVTDFTVENARNINQERQQLGLPTLTIELCTLETDPHGEIISSTRIRGGEINRDGYVYMDLFATDVVVSTDAKELMKHPFGEVTPAPPTISTKNPVILIGDVTTKQFVEANIPFSLAYIDGRSKRSPYSFVIPKTYTSVDTALHNEAGSISRELASHMNTKLNSSTNAIYKISGEEDLLTCVAVLLSPLGSHVLYGQSIPPAGIVDVFVTEDAKERMRIILTS